MNSLCHLNQTFDRVVCLLWIVIAAGSVYSAAESRPKKGNVMNSMTVTSPAFSHNQPIPARFTCDGDDISPPLAWKGVPGAAKSLALICDDPDAPVGTWVHWVVYNLPPAADSLPEHIAKTDTLSSGAKQGITDFKRIGYGGPCPPSGTHRYFFKLYALDTMIALPAGRSKKEIERAMQGHILAFGELVGTYSRKR
jgi:Raf kinase inhibitor-like YbhB/YbcL family protein